MLFRSVSQSRYMLFDVLFPVESLSVIAFIYVLVAKRLVSFSFFMNKVFAYGLTGLLLLGLLLI